MRLGLEDETEPEMSTDDIVAAFRLRKAAAQDPPEVALAKSAPAPPSPPAATTPPPAPEWLPGDDGPRAPDSHPSAVAVRPGPLTPGLRPAVEGGGALTAQAPALNLSDRLLADRFVTSRGSRAGVTTGTAVALLGVVGYALLRIAAARGTGLPLWWGAVSAGLAVVGLALAMLFLFVPASRSLRVRLAATQREEWARVQTEAAKLRSLSLAGSLVGAAGLLGAAAAERLLASPATGYAVAGGLAMAAFGLGILVWAAARRSLVQRLYVQTLVLSRLEQTGLGPAAEPDPRVAPVLRSLDKLLGALPESAVRRFLASDEATQYLELIDDLSGDRHGR